MVTRPGPAVPGAQARRVSELGVTDLVAALRRGEVVAVPTDTVYGLAVDPRAPGGVERVFAAKSRPESTALPVLVADLAQAEPLVHPADHAALSAIAGAHWPGALTVVARRAAGVDVALGGDGRTIGLRCSLHPAVRALCRAVGPLAVTSANLHGGTPCTTAAEVRSIFGAVLPVLDGGPCVGVPSTVVALTSDGGARLLRTGPVALADVLDSLARAARP